MSAIGEYIHLNAKNYNRYGITRKTPQEKYNFNQQKQNVKSKMNFAQIQDKKSLEDALNSIFDKKDNSNVNTIQIRKEIENILNDFYQESLGKINWKTGNIQSKITNSKNITQKSIQTAKDQQSIELKTILKRVRAIETLRNNIKSQEERKELTNKINQIYEELNYILTGSKRGMLTKLKNSSLNKIQNKLVNLNNPQTEGLVTTINTLLKTYAAVPAVNLQKGDLFEYMIALAPAVARTKSGDELEKFIKQMKNNVVGSSRSKIEINFDKNNFSQNINLNNLELKGYVVSENGRTAYTFKPSQEKIDVMLEWDNKIYPISAKNINLKSGFNISVLSNSSLLYLLQDENPDFVNHYFNIIGTHQDSVPIDANISMAHDMMKYTLLFKALTGQTYNRDNAEIFIINDNSTGRVKVFNIGELIEKASSNLDLYTKITANGASLEALKINNQWKPTINERLNYFINEVHKQKIKASLTPNLIK